MSLSAYDDLTSKCKRDSAEFAVWMSGIMVDHSMDGQFERISESAANWSRLRCCSLWQSVPDIEKVIAGPRQS